MSFGVVYFNLRLIGDNKCRECVETVKHLFCVFPVFGRQRLSLLGAVQLHNLQSAKTKEPMII